MLALYKNIKEQRERLGLSQEELALKTGYSSRSSIAKIEKGLVDLTQSKIALFAKALNTTQSELMGWTDSEQLEPTIAAHLDGDFTEEERKDIESYIEFVKTKRKEQVERLQTYQDKLK